ncbi:hypothetical protein GUITHDRAFT_114071 [Guillardia theta CCMP2712]|uniref:Uncharacterized protein n=1 Tax=Guillardia theta (strain CCMP2712) TaxID=905079 RepID=L1IVH3_GUITC|nr:hypothetical protein GUITHDRAFT_114071 [Guillardia theta CCMP2712]EKX39820.1 hypothetical protein GUITHDRAFT_114071 [Guillardia theta CCMP2712]|eukprot:XP_005826800.1 hypothetical protein GUITHDRAFT_114071 [Guillardia theta CCMP2712]
MNYLQGLLTILIVVSANDAAVHELETSGFIADMIRQGQSKIELRKGAHLLDHTLSLRLARSVSVFGEERKYKIEDEKYQLGPEKEVKVRGSWFLEQDLSKTAEGRFENLYLLNERQNSDPRTSAGVFFILGGNWDFNKCCIMGTGTGFEAPALIIIGGELDEERPLDSPMCQSPKVSMYQTKVQELPIDQREFNDSVVPQDLNNLIYVGGNSTFTAKKCELSGAVMFNMMIYGNSAVKNKAIFAFVLGKHRVTLRKNKFVGKVFLASERFDNATLIEEDNIFDPFINLRSPPNHSR